MRELCFGLIEQRLERAWINLEEDLPFADRRTFFVVLLDEISRYLRLDLRVLVPVHGSHPFLKNGNVLLDDPDVAETPVVVMTSLYTAVKYQAEGYTQFRVTDYLSKPLDVDKLLSLVRVWMPR